MVDTLSTIRTCWPLTGEDTTQTSLFRPKTKTGGGNEFIETLTALLKTVDSLPRGSLPAAQEAAMRLVRRVAARMPTAGDAAPDVGEETSWWHLDRHHGMGRLAYNSRKTLTDIPGEH